MSLMPLVAQAHGLEQVHDWLGAAQVYAQALALEPDNDRLLISLGNVLWLADLAGAAEGWYRQAVQLVPEDSMAWRGLGNCLKDLNRFEEAVLAYDRAAACTRESGRALDPAIAWACSQVRIGLEDYRSAYAEAEHRSGLPSWKPWLPSPCWGDEALLKLDPRMGVWIWSEQGFGDILQYLRWVPQLVQQRQRGENGGDVILVVESSLIQLLREGLAWLPRPPRVVDKSAVSAQGNEPQAHGSLLSLPHELGPPIPEAPYLRSPLWSRSMLSLLPAPPQTEPAWKVGLVWAAGRNHEDPYKEREYRKRSLPAQVLWSLVMGLRAEGAWVVDLQFGEDQGLAAALGLDLAAPRLELTDFSRAARVVQELDLVISVDTAMAHLVGAMGAPGWILLPWSADPRWLRDRDDSPWYPSLRLFRQRASGDWGGTIDAVLLAFSEWSAARASC